LENHAYVMQAGDEAAAVHLLAAAGPVRKADYVGAVLAQTGLEGQSLGVPRQRDEAGLSIHVIAYQNPQLAAGL
jgi:hypothetical protein